VVVVTGGCGVNTTVVSGAGGWGGVAPGTTGGGGVVVVVMGAMGAMGAVGGKAIGVNIGRGWSNWASLRPAVKGRQV
jgi:hypothetical protein